MHTDETLTLCAFVHKCIHCRARLVASDRGQQAEASTSTSQGPWAHDLTKPEKGCLLLAHPLMFGNSQSYFSQVLASGHMYNSRFCLYKSAVCTNKSALTKIVKTIVV